MGKRCAAAAVQQYSTNSGTYLVLYASAYSRTYVLSLLLKHLGCQRMQQHFTPYDGMDALLYQTWGRPNHSLLSRHSNAKGWSCQ